MRDGGVLLCGMMGCSDLGHDGGVLLMNMIVVFSFWALWWNSTLGHDSVVLIGA